MIGRWCNVGKHQFATLAFATYLLAGVSGCQVDVGGQTLPSPYYFEDDIHYAPSGPEFQLSREAAAMKAYQANFEDDEP